MADTPVEHKFGPEAGAALVFAVLYAGLFAWMSTGYITGRFKLRSRWSLLYFHVCIRVASQVSLAPSARMAPPHASQQAL